MSDDSRLDSLLLRFEELRDFGSPVSPEELCKDFPELEPELRRRIAALAPIDGRLQTSPARHAAQFGPADRYTILRRHAKGGLGQVFLAQDMELPRQVALKEIQPRRDNSASRARFLKEAELTGSLEHPGIVPVYSLGEFDDGRPFYAMRFIGGESLANAIRAFHSGKKAAVPQQPDQRPERDQRDVSTVTIAVQPSQTDTTSDPLAPPPQNPTRVFSSRNYSSLAFRQLLARFVAMCNTVDFAHSRKVIHRDIKPDNVMLGEFGETLLVDWGLAKRIFSERPALGPVDDLSDQGDTQEGTVLGTPAYMSPQQAEGCIDDFGFASDVYSLGATLYHLLTGRPPFTGPTALQIIAAVKSGKFDRPRAVLRSIPRSLEEICLKAMSKEPSHRYTRARDLAQDIDRFLADEPVSAWREPLSVRTARLMRKHRGVARTAALALIVLFAVTSFAAWRESYLRGKETVARIQAQVAEDETLVAYRASTDDAVEKLIGSKPELGTQERAYLTNTLGRWQAFANRRGDDERSQAIRAEGCYRVALLLQRLGGKEDAIAAFTTARDLMKTVVSRSAAGPESRLRLATSHHQLGVLLADLDRSTEADAEHTAALTLKQELVAQNPQSEQYSRELAKTRLALGVLREKLDPVAAQREFELARDIQTDLLRRFPNHPEGLQILALSQGHLGSTHFVQGRLDEALAAFQASRDTCQTALDLDSHLNFEFQHALVNARANVARLLAAKGNRGEARAELEATQSLREKLSRDFPAVHEYQLDVAAGQFDLAGLLTELKEHEAARAALEDACRGLRRLIEIAPTVPEYQKRLAEAHNRLASVLTSLNLLREARAELVVARKLNRTLADRFPQVPEYRNALAGIHNNLGLLRLELGEEQDAIAEIETAIKLQQDLVAEHRNPLKHRTNLAEIHNSLAMVFHRKSDFKHALDHYRAAQGEQSILVAQFPTHTKLQLSLARSCHNLGLLLTALKNYTDARTEFDTALRVLQGLRKNDPGNVECLALLGSTEFNFASLLSDQRDLAGARAKLESARDALLKVTGKAPHEPQYQLELSRVHINLAALLDAQGQQDRALAEYLAAREVLLHLVHDTNLFLPDQHVALAAVHNNLAILLNKLGKPEDSRREFQDAIKVHLGLVERFAAQPAYSLGLGNTYTSYGKFIREHDGPSDSLEWFDKAIAILEPLSKRLPSATIASYLRNSFLARAEARVMLRAFSAADLDWKRVNDLSLPAERPHLSLRRVLSRFQAGLIVEAVADSDSLVKLSHWQAGDWYNFACIYAVASNKLPDKQEQHASRAIDLLRKAVRSGYNNASQLTRDPDLAAISQREDFKKIVASLQKEVVPPKPSGRKP